MNDNVPTFLLSFVKRYWKLLLFFVVLVLISKVDQVTYFTGPIFYLIEQGVGAIVGALLIRHVFYTKTLDAFSQQGPRDENGKPTPSDFEKAWAILERDQQLKWSLMMAGVFFLGMCWIAAAIAK